MVDGQSARGSEHEWDTRRLRLRLTTIKGLWTGKTTQRERRTFLSGETAELRLFSFRITQHIRTKCANLCACVLCGFGGCEPNCRLWKKRCGWIEYVWFVNKSANAQRRCFEKWRIFSNNCFDFEISIFIFKTKGTVV